MNRSTILLGLGLLSAVLGCASPTYRFAVSPGQLQQSERVLRNPIVVGGESPRLDRLENIIHYPAKKFRQWFPPKTPAPDPEVARAMTVLAAQEYLACNDMGDVYIDVREYNPKEQWRRLKANESIHPFWKYTGGLISHVQYTLIPDRLMRTDNFNPFTNTLTLGSTQPSSAIYQSATAKVLKSKSYPGAFATCCYLPLVPLYRDVQVANDALSYCRAREDWQIEKRLYPEIYGRFGADVISEATSLIPGMSYMPFYYQPLVNLGGGIAGTATGRFVLNLRENEVENSSSNSSTTHPQSASDQTAPQPSQTLNAELP